MGHAAPSSTSPGSSDFRIPQPSTARKIAGHRTGRKPPAMQRSAPRPTALGAAILLAALLIGNQSCKHEPPVLPEIVFNGGGGGGGTGGTDTINLDPCDPDTVYFQNTILPLLISYCAGEGCHDAITHEEGVRLYDYSHIMQQVTPGNPGNSDLWTDGITEGGDDAMPPPGEPQLTSEQEQLIYTWIMQGALNNSCTECDTTEITFSGNILPLFAGHCNGCHSGSSPDGGLDLTSWAVGNTIALDGRLAGAVQHDPNYTAMPPSGNLSACQIDQILMWIADGAPNN